MKKMLVLAASLLLFASCDYILKERDGEESEATIPKKVVLGTDKDEMGCVASAGYRWSLIRKECIRIFEEGYRLNAIDKLKEEGASQSAFIIFEEGGSRAELFLPDGTASIMLVKEKDGSYKSAKWTLNSQKGYTLSKNGTILFAGAAIEEQKITGDDKAES